MCGYLCTGFINFVLKKQSRFWKNDDEKIYFIKSNKYRKFTIPLIYYDTTTIPLIFDKTLILSIICDKCGSKDEKIFKEEESIEV